LIVSWRWNLGREERQSKFHDAKFVPRIAFLRIDGKAKTAAVWPDGIPTVIPPVDYLIIVRRHLNQKSGRAEDHALLAWEAVRPLLGRYGLVCDDQSIMLNYDREPPADVRSFLQSLPSHTGELAYFGAAEVLDSELVEKYAR
jgi:hypothetical protein